MEVIILLVVAGLAVSTAFLFAFAWATTSGQYDDTATPPLRMLSDDPLSDPYMLSTATRKLDTQETAQPLQNHE